MSYPFSNYKDDDITPEFAKLDELMNSIAKEMEDETSLAASVVTAFLKKEHDLVEQNAGGYPSIIQVHKSNTPCHHTSPYSVDRKYNRDCKQTVNYYHIEDCLDDFVLDIVLHCCWCIRRHLVSILYNSMYTFLLHHCCVHCVNMCTIVFYFGSIFVTMVFIRCGI